MKTIAALLLGLLGGAAMTGAGAQTVYRCGSEYSQLACPQATAIDVSDPRSEAQRAEAQRVAEAERRLAARMRRDRLAAERASKPALAGSLSGPGKPGARPKKPVFGQIPVRVPRPEFETSALDR